MLISTGSSSFFSPPFLCRMPVFHRQRGDFLPGAPGRNNASPDPAGPGRRRHGLFSALRGRVAGQREHIVVIGLQEAEPLQHLIGQLRLEQQPLAVLIPGEGNAFPVVPGGEQRPRVPLGALVQLPLQLERGLLQLPGQLLHRLGVPVDAGAQLGHGDRGRVIAPHAEAVILRGDLKVEGGQAHPLLPGPP